MKHTIVAYKSVRDMTGQGMEALSDDNGNIIAVFSEGNFITSTLSQVRVGSAMVAEPTLILSEGELLYA